MERTFAIIKPDAVEKALAGQILARIEAAGFTVRAMRLQHLSKKEAEGFYAVHRERPFFGSLTEFMSSGPCVLLALEAPDALDKVLGFKCFAPRLQHPGDGGRLLGRDLAGGHRLDHRRHAVRYLGSGPDRR